MPLKLKELFSPKLIPNSLTLLRAMIALLIFIVTPFTWLFYLIYVVCALTDMLDGFLARRLNAVTSLGQSLDSCADLVFFIAVCIRIIPLLEIEPWMLIWTGMVLLVKIISLIVGFVKFREFSFLHTYQNKLTGLLLFVYPPLIGKFGLLFPTVVVCIIASFAALEEQIILLKLKKLHRDIRGLFEVRTSN